MLSLTIHSNKIFIYLTILLSTSHFGYACNFASTDQNAQYLQPRSVMEKLKITMPEDFAYTFLIGGANKPSRVLWVDLSRARARLYQQKAGFAERADQSLHSAKVEVAIDAEKVQKLIALSRDIYESSTRYANMPPKFGSLDVRLLIACEALVRDEPSYGPPQREVAELLKQSLEFF